VRPDFCEVERIDVVCFPAFFSGMICRQTRHLGNFPVLDGLEQIPLCVIQDLYRASLVGLFAA